MPITRTNASLRTKKAWETRKKEAAAVGAGAAAGAAAGARHKKPVLSPYKLYKHDMKNQRVARTWGPKGKPYVGCKGSTCYRHKNVDWTVHRLAPTLADEKGPRRATKIGRIAATGMKKGPDKTAIITNPTSVLRDTSPRWGRGIVPGRMEGRNSVNLPGRGKVGVSKGTKVAAGVAAGAAAGYGGYKGYQYIKNHRNAKTGTRSARPTTTKGQGRVRKKTRSIA